MLAATKTSPCRRSSGRDGLTFAIDFSDISKVFGGRGMEGMAMGLDGSTKTHALLAGIRALVGEARIRFISGRPRKRPREDDRQLVFAGF